MMSKLLKNYLLIFYVCFCSLLSVNHSFADSDSSKSTFVFAGCSDWKPYCYKEDDLLQGSIVDVSKRILDAAGVKHTFDVYPWVRVYHKGLNEANFLVLGLGRTQKREALFKWIAPLKQPAKIHAYQLANSEFSLEHVDDLKEYEIAVERGSYTYDYLLSRGHDEEKIITISRYSQLFKVLLHGRAQLFLLDDGAFIPEAKRNGFDHNDFKRSILAFTVTEYLATSNKTSDAVVERLKTSYETLKSQGKITLPK